MNTPMTQLASLEALADRLEGNRKWPEAVRAQAARVGGDRVVLFEDLDINPARDRTPPQILLVGPGCTYTNPEAVSGHHLGDVPSRFLWPTAWAWVNTPEPSSEGDQS